MAKDYIKINTPLELAYYKGNVVVNYKYNHKTFRYNLLKIDSGLYLPKIRALKPNDNIYNCEETFCKSIRRSHQYTWHRIHISRN